MATDTQSDARVVDGSDGFLLEIDGQIVPNYDATLRPFDEGDVVTGRVVRIDNDEVLVDIGYKSEGVIPSNELSIRKSVDPHDEVEMGEEVDALVLTKEDQDGRLIMSKKRARFEKAWRRIEAAQESGEPIPGSVIEVVKGGLIIDLGVRGFLPASLVDIRRVANLDEFMGQTLECKVIELNRSRNNVVLSRRAVLEEERKEQRQEILDRLQPGLVVEGVISNIVDFGAFVDLNGIDGLIHISELSWSHVNHPSEVITIGDQVQVKVLDIDRDRQRISLGLKQTQEDPWQRVVSMYHVGDELEGKVTKVVTFGAFVEILDGVEGLVHISELAPYHVENPREIVEPGAELKVKILEIDSERRRLSLSAKRVEARSSRPARATRAGRRERHPDPTDAGTSTTCLAGLQRGRLRGGDFDRGGGSIRPPSSAGASERRPRRRTRPLAAAPRRRSHRGSGGRRRVRRQRARGPGRCPTREGRRAPPRRTRPLLGGRAALAVPFVGLTGASVGQVDRAGGARAPRRGTLSPTRSSTSCTRAPRCATPSSPAGATTSPRAASSTARRSRATRSPTRRAPVARGLIWPLVGARVAAFREEALGADPPPRAAVVETPLLFEAASTRCTTRRSPSSPTRTCAAARAAPRPRGRRRARRPPAHAGREGRPRDARRAQRRHGRGARGRAVRRPRDTRAP
jgi:small subunit ribosomal protein S1